jgi:hypothetical protein
MSPKLRRSALAAGLAAALLISRSSAMAQGPQNAAATDEDFHYHWQLGNIVGTVIGLFLPHQGNGELAFKSQKDGHLRGELLITSPDSPTGEYYRYGSEIDPRTLQPIRAWSSYLWRGKSKSKNEEIEEKGVLDIACAIYAIRHEPPLKATNMEIWSDGKIYPVTMIPMGNERRTVSNRQVDTRHYAIRGRDIADRRHWTAKVDFWLARDAVSTPVEIQISRRLADVRLELLPVGAAS